MHWLRANRWSRVAVIVLTFLIPIANVFSAVLVISSARHSGWRSAALDVGAGLALLVGLVQLTGGAGAAPFTAAWGAGALWASGLVGGLLLGRFKSVDLAVQVLVVLAVGGVVAAGVIIPDPRAHWQPILEELIQAAGLPQVAGLPPGWLATVASLMHGIVGASLLSTVILALLLELWLDREAAAGQWRRLFLAMRLGRLLSLAAFVAAAFLLAGFISAGGSVLLVLGTGFAAQGLAVVHWTAELRRWPGIWPLIIYGPLLLGPPPAGAVLLALAIVGLVDNGVGLRRHRSNVV